MSNNLSDSVFSRLFSIVQELTRYKARCEELESPQRQAELDGLRSQVQELRSVSESSSRETQELHQRLATLQAEYQQTVRQHEEDSHSKVSSLEAEVDKLHADLAKAQHELEETLAVNASLNKELQSALKNPTSPRIGSAAGFAGGSEDVARLHTELEQCVGACLVSLNIRPRSLMSFLSQGAKQGRMAQAGERISRATLPDSVRTSSFPFEALQAHSSTLMQ